MPKTFTLDGNNINDIASFYEEVNRVFMSDEEWSIGQSLDALNDLFYGGFGAIKGHTKIRLIWTNVKQSKQRLGVETTRNLYQEKLKHPELYNIALIKQNLAALEAQEGGATYFEIVLEIIANHTNIELVFD